ncbi:uncharacterized protein METZ01_LOCUS246660, partial [marine metagenome]
VDSIDKRTLGQVLVSNMSHHGSRIAIIENEATWTYQEFGNRVHKLANF